MATEPKEQLKTLLRELFQLDKTDLDFGIYRIMNLRAKDTEDFIDKQLPDTLKEVTLRLAEKGKKDVATDAGKIKQDLIDFALANFEKDISEEWEFNLFVEKNKNIVPVKKYLEAKEAVREDVEISDTERAIYNDLYNFFNRYYEGGDFISKPRAGESKYMIPYNGEEVKFYWANHDQYYIKTGENFRNYVFTNEKTDKASVTVEFRLIDAETAVNNNKENKNRVFVPTEDYFKWDKDERTLTIEFYYKVPDSEEKEKWGDKQSVKTGNKGINENLIFNLLDEQITATKDKHLIELWNETRTIKTGKKEEELKTFYYHLNRYTNTNSFDYFIHKDLRTFLRRELDYFLKNEIFDLSFTSEDYSPEDAEKLIKNNLVRASAIREIGVKLIEFLAEIEDFQKMLFEKKKFVVQSDYCLTLDQIPTEVFDEIVGDIQTDKNKKQINEWHNLGFIESLEMTAADIKADKFLVLDTQFLPAELKFKLLGKIENLDEKCGGLLINSDNFQALNFLQNKYRSKIKCIYIDPPYNTGKDGFIYKDNLEHSSWISMMENRLKIAKSFLNSDGAIFVSIDDDEIERLKMLQQQIFSSENFVAQIVWQKKFSPQNDAKWFSDNHDFITCFALDKNSWRPQLLERTNKQNARYKNPDNDPRGVWTSGDCTVRSYNADYDYPVITPSGKEIEPTKGRCWFTNEDEFKNLIDDNRIWFGKSGENVPRLKNFLSEVNDGLVPLTVWTHEEVGHNQEATQELRSLNFSTFSSPKPKRLLERIIGIGASKSDYILDFFAGSGTTGHAVINLNREDIANGGEGKRKYILVEMGEYFDTVTKPRIQKVVYANKWKNGKPVRDKKPPIADENQNETNGISHIFQYIKLEQYEDTLNNIEFSEQAEANKQKLNFAEAIRYILKNGTSDSKTLLDIEAFQKPFDYEMDIIRLNERKATKVDLVTTFNFLLGIDVERYFVEQHQKRDYTIIKGKKGLQEYQIIWRNFENLSLDEERVWITKTDWFSKDAHSYTNADNAFRADSIEREFKRLMFEDVNY